MDWQSFFDKVLEHRTARNWRAIINLDIPMLNNEYAKLLWVWPSEENLLFIKEKLHQFNIDGIVSIGCGCGLLEWVLQQYLNCEVVGVEVNKTWWESKYSLPLFISHVYPNTPLNSVDNTILKSTYALLFCYFNNRPAFHDYINNYEGSMVIIIGPGENRGTHTDPTPFGPNFTSPGFRLHCNQEVKDTKDFIAIYVRDINK